MSPTITGNASPAVHDHGHVDLTTRRNPDADLDLLDYLARARARRGICSPIKSPEGGWTGPEPVLAPETPPKPKPKKRTARPRTPRPKPAPKPRKSEPTPEQVNELRQQWQRFRDLAAAGCTARQIADALDLKIERVRRDAKAAGITLTRGTASGRPSGWDIDKAICLAEQGLTAREIAEQVDAATVTVRRVLTRRGITLTDGRSKYSGGNNSKIRRGDVDPQHVADLYAQHGNARTVGTSGQTVTRILHSLDVPVRPSADVQKGRPGSDRAAALKALMHAHGITSANVRSWARANGHDVADRGIPTRAVIDAYIHHQITTTKEKRA